MEFDDDINGTYFGSDILPSFGNADDEYGLDSEMISPSRLQTPALPSPRKSPPVSGAATTLTPKHSIRNLASTPASEPLARKRKREKNAKSTKKPKTETKRKPRKKKMEVPSDGNAAENPEAKKKRRRKPVKTEAKSMKAANVPGPLFGNGQPLPSQLHAQLLGSQKKQTEFNMSASQRAYLQNANQMFYRHQKSPGNSPSIPMHSDRLQYALRNGANGQVDGAEFQNRMRNYMHQNPLAQEDQRQLLRMEYERQQTERQRQQQAQTTLQPSSSTSTWGSHTFQTINITPAIIIANDGNTKEWSVRQQNTSTSFPRPSTLEDRTGTGFGAHQHQASVPMTAPQSGRNTHEDLSSISSLNQELSRHASRMSNPQQQHHQQEKQQPKQHQQHQQQQQKKQQAQTMARMQGNTGRVSAMRPAYNPSPQQHSPCSPAPHTPSPVPVDPHRSQPGSDTMVRDQSVPKKSGSSQQSKPNFFELAGSLDQLCKTVLHRNGYSVSCTAKELNPATPQGIIPLLQQAMQTVRSLQDDLSTAKEREAAHVKTLESLRSQNARLQAQMAQTQQSSSSSTVSAKPETSVPPLSPSTSSVHSSDNPEFTESMMRRLNSIDNSEIDKLHGSGIGIMYLSLSYGVKWANAEVTKVCGWENSELLSGFGRIHPKDVAGVYDAICQLLDGAPSVAGTSRVRHKNGHYIKINVIRRLYLDDNGDRVLVVAFAPADQSPRAPEEAEAVASPDEIPQLQPATPEEPEVT